MTHSVLRYKSDIRSERRRRFSLAHFASINLHDERVATVSVIPTPAWNALCGTQTSTMDQ